MESNWLHKSQITFTLLILNRVPGKMRMRSGRSGGEELMVDKGGFLKENFRFLKNFFCSLSLGFVEHYQILSEFHYKPIKRNLFQNISEIWHCSLNRSIFPLVNILSRKICTLPYYLTFFHQCGGVILLSLLVMWRISSPAIYM